MQIGSGDLLTRGSENVAASPMDIITLGEIAAEMCSAGFLPSESGINHEAGDGEQILQFPSRACVELAEQDVPAPEIHVLLGLT